MFSKKKSEYTSDYLSMVKIEYAAMREEIHLSHSHIFVVLQLYFPIVGVLLDIAIKNKADRIIFNSILAIIIPIISLSSITFILSESMRMKRAGDYICILESKVKKIISFPKKINNSWQANIENELKITKSDIDLLNPLAFESWIRNLSSGGKREPYGRASLMLQIRFIILFLIPFLSVITSLGIGLYDIKVNSSQSVIITFSVQFIGIIISLIWGIPILISGFGFSKQSMNQMKKK